MKPVTDVRELFRHQRAIPEDSAVTVVAVRRIYPVREGTQSEGHGVLGTLVASMRIPGTPIYHQMNADSPLIVLQCPEHADEIARAGFSRRDVRQHIFDHARLPVRALEGRGNWARLLAGVDRCPGPGHGALPLPRG